MLGSPNCLAQLITTPFYSPTSWSVSGDGLCSGISTLNAGLIDSAHRDLGQYQNIPSSLVSLDLQVSRDLVQEPMPSVLKQSVAMLPTEKEEPLAEPFHIKRLSKFIQIFASNSSGDQIKALENLLDALTAFFTQAEEIVGKENADLSRRPEEYRPSISFDFSDNTALWLELLCNENIADNLNPDLLHSHVDDLLRTCERIQFSLMMGGPVLARFFETLARRLRKLLKPEAALLFDRAKYSQAAKDIKTHPLLAQFPSQTKKIASLIELSLYETCTEYRSGERFMDDLLYMASDQHKSAVADLLISIINKAKPEQLDAMLAFTRRTCYGFNQCASNVVDLIEASSGGCVGKITNERFLARLINLTVSELKECVRLVGGNWLEDSSVFDYYEGISSVKEVIVLFRQLLIYNPSIAFVRVLIKECVSAKMQNQLMLILKNIPKKIKTRDARRFLGGYILNMFQQELLTIYQVAEKWGADQVGEFSELIRRRNTIEADMLNAVDQFELEELKAEFDDVREIIDDLDLEGNGIGDYEVLTTFGYDFNDYAEYEVQRDSIGQFYRMLTSGICRDLPGIVEQQDLALVFVEFGRVLSNFYRILLQIGVESFVEQLRSMRQERGKKEFLLSEDIRAFTVQIKLLAIDHFFETCSLSQEMQQKIKGKIQDPKHCLSDEVLLSQLMSYHGFQAVDGKKAVEDFLVALVEREKHKKGIMPIQERITMTHTQSVLSEDYLEIYNSMLEHLGVDSTNDISNEDLKDIIQEVESALRKGQKISPAEVASWKEALEAQKLEFRDFDIDEVLVDLDKIYVVNQAPEKQEDKEYDFFVTGDLVAILKAGEEPIRTCQRISSAGRYNINGEPVKRALHSNVSMAGLKDPKTGRIVARVVLEFVEPGIVLVERLYKSKEVSRQDFNIWLLRMLLRSKDVKQVVFADRFSVKEATSSVVVGDLPTGYYRDTFRSNATYHGVNIMKGASVP
jgi:hypothetical protein